MLKTGKHSPSPHKQMTKKQESRHWSQKVHESIVSSGPEGLLNLVVKGGAENGQYCWIGDIKQDKINYHSGKLQQDDIILEIQGQKVAGFTLRDLLDWLKHVSKNGAPVMFKTVKAGLLTKDLRTYLNTRFAKNSIDHDLQQTIRDNLYRRTVPCTTREVRAGEKNGVDYTFLTVDQFLALEKSGNLLESGLFDGNHYGTPKPPKEPLQPSPFRRTSSVGTLNTATRGRSRNRSGPGGGNDETEDDEELPPPPLARKKSLERAAANSQALAASNLGPLPPNWEMAYTEDGTPYFIDHDSESTHWLDPRLTNNQKMSPLECKEDELPYGWEKVEDPHYGTYFIDHVTRKTQYENPVEQAKKEALTGKNGTKESNGHNGLDSNKSPPAYGSHKAFFTRNPEELRGEFLQVRLQKSQRGFGFTIVGGDEADAEEFLQIKNVVPNGPAHTDGQLQTGDVLVFVNETCVLGFTHQDVVSMFQTLPIGQYVSLQVCRGYPLPFDPNDPNTEIITTVAVNLPDDNTPGLYTRKPAHSPPGYEKRNEWTSEDDDEGGVLTQPPQLLSIGITKGQLGFGFTIADSAYGQKVKQILDRPRCKTLQEGDILVEINGRKVKDLPHGDVVNVLKECSKDREANVLVQRGGVLSKKRSKTPTPSEDERGRSDFHNVPTSPFYSPDVVKPAERSHTPRPKTPTTSSSLDLPDSRADMYGVDLYHPAAAPAVPDPYSYRQRTDQMNRSFNQFDRAAGTQMERGRDMEPHQQNRMRSRTPGPDFMRRRDDEFFPGMDNRAPQPPRSKTPTHDHHQQQQQQQYQHHSSLSGTPDFIPASQYQANNENPPDIMYRQQQQYPDHVYANNGNGPNPRLNSSQSYGSALNSHVNRTANNYSPQISPHVLDPSTSGSRLNPPPPRKQSTSFEHVEPAPSNLTRIPPHRGGGGAGGMGTPYEDEWLEMTVYLTRQESGFGFRIIGGTEEGSQVSVGHIVPGGAADVDGQLRPYDEIIYVDGLCVIGASHHKVVQIMGQAAGTGEVTLGVRRRITHADSPSNSSNHSQQRVPVPGGGGVIGNQAPQQQQQQELYPYDVLVNRRENEGFGFVIISSVTRAGSVIGRIIENSPAERCKRLHVGDRILAVNKTSIMHMHHEDIVNLIKESGTSVTLTVGPPLGEKDDASSTASTSQRSSQGSMINAMAFPTHSESDLSRRSDYSPYHYSQAGQDKQKAAPPMQRQQQQQQQQQQQGYTEQASMEEDEQDRFYAVELHRGSRGFGFSIRGGKEFNNMSLYVLRIADGGAADVDRRLRVGDQIIEINGYNTSNMTHAEAIDLIQNGGGSVKMLVKRQAKVPQHLGGAQSGVGNSSGGVGRLSSNTPSPHSAPPPPPAAHSSPQQRLLNNRHNDPMMQQQQRHNDPMMTAQQQRHNDQMMQQQQRHNDPMMQQRHNDPMLQRHNDPMMQPQRHSEPMHQQQQRHNDPMLRPYSDPMQPPPRHLDHMQQQQRPYHNDPMLQQRHNDPMQPPHQQQQQQYNNPHPHQQQYQPQQQQPYRPQQQYT